MNDLMTGAKALILLLRRFFFVLSLEQVSQTK